ncbi:type I restriction-modification system subunit M [Streptomyces katsurahamanus]|uniref:type I restriction-modification system subunit M n=1 Tax=Streptomyces katsurahamanus TaxID=2577098 RepID=UPI002B1FEE07|nr:class I SAM-dependent DNA methyltransferase [Streptomyces katsurahamanus]
MAIRKSDLYSSLWRSCDELRGGMDASQYKDYILSLLFVKYVTDKAKSDPYSLITVPDGGSFDDMVALKGDKDIGERIDGIIGALAEANDLRGVIDLADFGDEEKLGKGKEMQDRLSQLLAIFADLDFRGSRAEGDDLLGDAYEYLMRHFATESGKSKGQFYTPAEVSRVLAKIVGIGPHTGQDQTVYDPTCGSGSLLLKVADEAPRGLTIYGQEKDNATWALSQMNMILHGNAEADIRKGDTLTSPQFTAGGELKTFDFAVANPPFSLKSWTNGLEQDFGRFELGTPPEKNGDYAFLLHVLTSLKSTGKAAVILPLGVLFRGHAEAAIRRKLLNSGYIKGIIGLPANLFYGTSIPACVIVLDKENAGSRSGVFMIDASRGFLKDGNKNRLRSQDIHKIVDVFTKQTGIERYARMVPLTEIADPKNDYSLNIPRYIDSSEPEDVQDLPAHLHGGIPDRDVEELSGYWDAFPSLNGTLFQADRPGYRELAVPVGDVQQAVLDSDEFRAFSGEVRREVDDWFGAHRPVLQELDERTVPNDLIATVGDDLLARFKGTALLDEYDVYEQLMTYWHSVVHDDVFLVMNEGWMTAARPRAARILGYDKNKKPKFEDADLQFGTGASAERYVMDLIPPRLVVSRYFAAEQAAVDELTVAADELTREIEEYVEEHAVEEGLLWDAVDDKGKVTQKSAGERLKEVREQADEETVAALSRIIGLLKKEAAAKKAAKAAQSAVDRATLEKYGDLTEPEIKRLVLDDKWHATITARVTGELHALSQALVDRIRQLGERYGETIGDLEAELSRLNALVDGHLSEMGVA